MEPYSKKAETCLALARQEAISRGQSTFDTGHVLLAFFLDGASRAFIVLESVGVPGYDVKKYLEKMKPRVGLKVSDAVPTANLAKALEKARQLCRDRGEEAVGEHHILMGILSSRDYTAWKIIKGLGFDPELVIEESEGRPNF
jgi:ATP-dependent Clp protease ATP-binding subunit ClpA